MRKQLLKAIGGYKVVYDSKRKSDRFIVYRFGTVEEHFKNFSLSARYVAEHVTNFDTIKENV